MKAPYYFVGVFLIFNFTICSAQGIKLDNCYPTYRQISIKTHLAASFQKKLPSSIMFSKKGINAYDHNRPFNYFFYQDTDEEISMGWLIGGLVGGAFGYWAGKNYDSGSVNQGFIIGDFIFQGMNAGAVLGQDIQKSLIEYENPESEYINNLDYYLWLQSIQN